MSVCQLCEVEHQPRERAVPCAGCRRPTFDAHALCVVCKHDAWNEREDEIGDAIFMRMLEERGL